MLSTPIRAFLARIRSLLIVIAAFGPAHTVEVSRRRYVIGGGRLLPAMAGGAPEDDDDDGDEDGDDDGATPEDDTDDRPDDDAEDGDEVDEDDLSDKVKAILDKERRSRRKAEREARRLKRAASKASRSTDDGGRRDDRPADDGKPDAGTANLQRANLLLALADKGYTGTQARMVARLLEDVDYDGQGEPTNLDDVLEEAAETYGDAIEPGRPAAPSKPKAPKTDAAAGNKSSEKAPALTAEEAKMAKAFRMSAAEYRAFKDPQHRPAEKKAD